MYYPSLGISLRKTIVGTGVFATRTFRKGQVIGRMDGEVIEGEDYDPSYVVEITGGVLNPSAPFRFLNHCCEANAQLVEEPKTKKTPAMIVVVALSTIRRGQEINIDYAWPAEETSLRCLCGAPRCRGWVVDEGEVPKMKRLEKKRIVEQQRLERLAPAAE